MTKVSIIIPVYNAEKTIERCLLSILNQTYSDYEIITVNDGSSDHSLEILKKYEKDTKGKVVVINQKNQGVAKTRNRAIKLAKGKYIMFIDNDDYFDKDYIETYVKEIESSDLDMVIGGYRRVNVDKKILFQEKLCDTEWSKYKIMAPWAKIYLASFLKKNKIEFMNYGIGEDVYFNLTAFSHQPKIKIIDYIGYNWFFNTKSISNTSQRGLNPDIDITYLLGKVKEQYKEMDSLLSYYFVRYYIWYLLFSGRNSTKKQFIREYKKIKKWFQEQKIKSSISPFSNKIKGESFKFRMIVFLFRFIEICHLMPLFAHIYCRG